MNEKSNNIHGDIMEGNIFTKEPVNISALREHFFDLNTHLVNHLSRLEYIESELTGNSNRSSDPSDREVEAPKGILGGLREASYHIGNNLRNLDEVIIKLERLL